MRIYIPIPIYRIFARVFPILYVCIAFHQQHCNWTGGITINWFLFFRIVAVAKLTRSTDHAKCVRKNILLALQIVCKLQSAFSQGHSEPPCKRKILIEVWAMLITSIQIKPVIIRLWVHLFPASISISDAISRIHAFH